MWGFRAGAVVAVAAAGVSLAGCGSFTSFQSAESLMQGETSVALTVARVADTDGVDVGVRARQGLGSGFEVGMEASAPLLVAGADLKWQFLHQGTEEEGGSPVSAAFDVGLGAGPLAHHVFGQAIVSRRWDWFEPYGAYRLQHVRVDADITDTNDDVYDSIYQDVVEQANRTGILFHQFFVGARIHVWNGLSIVPEVSLIFYEGERGIGDAGVAIEYRLE